MLMIDSLAVQHNDATQRSVSDLTVTLTLEQRAKSRLRVRLDDGRDAGIRLPRDERMQPGTQLLATSGERVEVVAAQEPVSVATTPDSLLFSIACYHLGNRHVALQIENGWLAYQPDHVLDSMLQGLGLQVESREQAFEPEDGAYAGGHHHHHDHDHHHDREHSHD